LESEIVISVSSSSTTTTATASPNACCTSRDCGRCTLQPLCTHCLARSKFAERRRHVGIISVALVCVRTNQHVVCAMAELLLLLLLVVHLQKSTIIHLHVLCRCVCVSQDIEQRLVQGCCLLTPNKLSVFSDIVVKRQASGLGVTNRTATASMEQLCDNAGKKLRASVFSPTQT
jgi:hypothetical protein